MSRRKSEDPASRESRKAERRAAAEAIRDQRMAKLEATNAATERLQGELRAVTRFIARRDELASHLSGFYEEIDKLTKGKSLLPVTPLMVEQANDIIRDAKEVVTGDTYLGRIKQFVPAGDNPVYPDVLVAMRGVRDSLGRCAKQLERRQAHIKHLLAEADTISAALELNLHDGLKTVSEEQVGERVELPVTTWFYEDEEGVAMFDFDAVDARDMEAYLSCSPGDDVSSFDDNTEGEEDEGEEAGLDEQG